MASYIWPPEDSGSGGGGVTSLNTLTGDLTLVAGSGISITPSGSNITIANTDAGGSVTSVALEDGSTSPIYSISGSPLITSGIYFYPLTYSPPIVQPAGTPGGFVIANIGIPFQYCFLQYTNASGSGTILAYNQCKANNS